MNNTIVVKYANVLIDLEVMGLLDLWFQLEYTTLATSVIVAERENAQHLTGDKALRGRCAARQVAHHGTFWIMERLFDSGKLCPRVAASKLRHVFTLQGEEKRFLPHKQGKALIAKWESA